MLVLAFPAFADLIPEADNQRTSLLDLTAYTSSYNSQREGWAYNPTGNNGDPVLTLTNYGTADAHSAPIYCPINTTIVVNGDCYVDNVFMGEAYDVITGAPDGYLNVTGTGTLNIYADQYHGKGINIALGGDGKGDEDILTISDVTINYYGMERTIYTAFYLRPAIYAFESITLTNVTLNTYEGGYAIWLVGHETIGALLTEETASTLLIDGCNINVQNISGNNWQYAKGLYATLGNIRIRNSNVNIEAGSCSIWAYQTVFFDVGANVNVMSTPISNVGTFAVLSCNRIKILSGAEFVHIGCNRNLDGESIYTKEEYSSVLGDGLTVTIGSFVNGTFHGAPDPNCNNWPAFEVTNGSIVEPTYYNVSFYDYDGTLLSTQQVAEGGSAVPPTVPGREGYTFTGWNGSYENIHQDTVLTAQYSVNSYSLIIYYVFSNGNSAAPEYTSTVPYGTAYSIPSPAVEGYVPDIDVVSGVMGVGGAVYTVTYTAASTLLLGDVDCNGIVNFTDISTLYAFMLGNAYVSDQGLLNADMDQNGVVNFTDVSALYCYLIGQ